MSNTVMVHLERLNSLQKLKFQQRHDERRFNKNERIPAYIDTTKSHENSIIIAHKPVDEIRNYILSVRKAQRALKKNTVLLWSGLVGFGYQAQEKINILDRNRQDELFYEIVKAISDYFNVDIQSLTVHRDESAMHSHFSLYGYNRDGKSLSMMIYKPQLAEIQDIAANTIKRFGLDIERGKKRIERIESSDEYYKTIHRTVHELHYDLPRELEALKLKISAEKSQLERLLQEKLHIQRELEAERERWNKEKKMYEEQLKQAQLQIWQEQEKVRKLKEYHEAIQMKLRQEKENYKATLIKLKHEVEAKKQELARLDNEKRKHEADIMKLQNEKDNMKVELENIKTELEAVIQSIDVEKLQNDVMRYEKFITTTMRFFETNEPDLHKKLISKYRWLQALISAQQEKEAVGLNHNIANITQ